MKSPYDLPDYHALIRGIREIDRAGGDSTVARLVAADWLQEHGDEPRATYIRWRCENPTPFSHPPGDGAGSLVLLDPAGPPIAVDLVPCYPGVQFDSAGGWVVGVRCSLAAWVKYGPDLCRRHPVREVLLTEPRPHPGTLIHNRYEPHTTTVSEAVWVFWPRPELPGPVSRALDRHYRNAEDAVKDLAANALTWAEAEADRPALSEVPA